MPIHLLAATFARAAVTSSPWSAGSAMISDCNCNFLRPS